MDEDGLDNWRRRAFDRVCTAIALEGARPYDLRHSFASLLLHEGRRKRMPSKSTARSTQTRRSGASWRVSDGT